GAYGGGVGRHKTDNPKRNKVNVAFTDGEFESVMALKQYMIDEYAIPSTDTWLMKALVLKGVEKVKEERAAKLWKELDANPAPTAKEIEDEAETVISRHA
ncbi:MAG: hypothetical protein KGI00_05495, partial [Candidatus Micrarchaeota archaeon]|nr:hypothetical protein [Candidatus Micrarchaeota archaeon]